MTRKLLKHLVIVKIDALTGA